jgi:predicted small lipoprotein YifL
MRAFMFLAVLGLAACGDDGPPANENAIESAPREVVPTNDTTAIDAVSGESANMAEDVDFLAEENELGAAGNAAAANEAGNAAR